MMIFSIFSQSCSFKTYFLFADYKIPGTPTPDGLCHFTYLSTSAQKGAFNSPRYPANYPSNTTCEYHFIGEPGTQVKIVFNFFKTKTRELASTGYKWVLFQKDFLNLIKNNLRVLILKERSVYVRSKNALINIIIMRYFLFDIFRIDLGYI